MQKYFYFSFLLVIVLSSCSGSKSLNKKNYDSDKALSDALLWEVQGKGLDAPSYVFGTIHLIDEDEFFWPPNTLSSLEKSEQVVFEIDMNQMSDMQNMMSMLQHMYMKDGKTLSDLYSEEEFTEISTFFSERGIPIALVGSMKPLLLSALVGSELEPGQGLSSNQSYEIALQEIANSSLKDIHGLEEIEDQIAVIDAIPYQAQAEILLESIRALNSGMDQSDELLELYKNQKIEEMVIATMEEETMSEYGDVLLDKRNLLWISRMEEFMKEKPTFFAVGAGHLAGENGVLRLLAKEGYKLKPLSLKENKD